jgi:hypothetical protein
MRNLIALITLALTFMNSTAFALEDARRARVNSFQAPRTSAYRAVFRRVQLGEISLLEFVDNLSESTNSLYQLSLYERVDLVDPELLEKIESMNNIINTLQGRIDQINIKQGMREAALAIAQMERIMGQISAALQAQKTGFVLAVAAGLTIAGGVIWISGMYLDDQRDTQIEQLEKQLKKEKQREEAARENIDMCEDDDEEDDDNSIIAETEGPMSGPIWHVSTIDSFQRYHLVNVINFFR